MDKAINSKWVRSQATFEAEASNARWKMSRFKIAGRFINPGSRVLDIGCGSMFLRDFLPGGCEYVPADLYAERDPRIIPYDMNSDDIPPGHFDAVAMIAVISAADYPVKVLKRVRERTNRLVITSARVLGTPKLGFFGQPIRFPVLDEAGWRIEKVATIPLPLRRLFDPTHKILLCVPA